MSSNINAVSDLSHYKIKENNFKMIFEIHLKLKSNKKDSRLKYNKLNSVSNEFMKRSVDKVLPTHINRSFEVY